jgi:acetyl esterase/lipase
LSDLGLTVPNLTLLYGEHRGTRPGWLMTRDPKLQETFLAAKEQISICGSVIDEWIAEQLRDVTFAEPLGFRPLTMDLYLPPEGGPPKPVVVFIHGGAWRSRTARDGGAFRDFPAVLASVAARNYVVASVNYRFSGEARFPAAVQDVALAIRWLRMHSAHFAIDSNRFVAWGSSAGGQIAAVLGRAAGPRLSSRRRPRMPRGRCLPSACRA